MAYEIQPMQMYNNEDEECMTGHNIDFAQKEKC